MNEEIRRKILMAAIEAEMKILQEQWEMLDKERREWDAMNVDKRVPH